jgi:hypothetical protein
MGRARYLQSNFNGGELSPRLSVRSDLQKFFSGQLRNENFFILTQGGVKKRPGTLVLGQTINNGKARLVEFFKSATDVLMLEFSHLKMRVWQSDYTLVLDGAAPYELTTSFSASDLPLLAFTQAADILIITKINGTMPPKVLQRYANDDWALIDYETRNGPFLPLAEGGLTLAASATTGTIQLDASAAHFDASKVGAIYRLRENVGNPPWNKWETNKAVTLGDLRQNAGRVYRAANTATTGTTPPIHWAGVVSDGAVNWEFVHDGAGIAKVTSIVSSTQANATVLSALPSTGATTFWEEGSFSPANGYPIAASIHQERLFFGQTLREPDTLFGSVSGGYSAGYADYKPGLGTGLVVDSDALKRTLTGGEIRPICHLISAGALYAFTPKSIEVISGPSDREPITPSGAAAISRPGYGASPWVFPKRAADEIIYVAFSGRRLMGLPWGDNGGDGRARDLSILTEHFGALGRFVQIAICEDPEPTIWVLNENGQLFGVAYSPVQEVVGWWRVVFGDDAKVEAISVLRRPDGNDELWLVVKRVIDGFEVRTIEHMPQFLHPQAPRDLGNYLDGAYFWNQWNDDAAKNVTISAAVLRGASTNISSNHDIFGPSDVGDDFWLRIDTKVGDSVVTKGIVKTKILSQSGPRNAVIEAITDIPIDFVNVPLIGFAKPLENLEDLSAWENGKVTVFADFEDLGEFEVDSLGTITMPRKTARGFAGKSSTGRIILMPMDIGSQIGTSLGAKIRADRFTVSVRDALKIEVGPINGHKEPILFRKAEAIMSNPAAPNDLVRAVPLAGSWVDVLDVEILASGPWPCEIAGLSVRVNVDE